MRELVRRLLGRGIGLRWIGFGLAFAALLGGCLPGDTQMAPTPTPKPLPTATSRPTATPLPTPSPTPIPTATATRAPLPTPGGEVNIIIMVPRLGDEVSSPLHIAGQARVPEGNVVVRLRDAAGKVLARERVSASRGAPEWGEFVIHLSFVMPNQPQQGRLEVFWEDQRTGSEKDLLVIPLRLAAG